MTQNARQAGLEAHRIGQLKHFFEFNLVTERTIEEVSQGF